MVAGPLDFRTYSRFARDPEAFLYTVNRVLYSLARAAAARGARTLRVWSVGCAGGEEPYSLAVAWVSALADRFPSVSLEIVATDVDVASLDRARLGVFGAHAVANLPVEWVSRCFAPVERGECLCDRADDCERRSAETTPTTSTSHSKKSSGSGSSAGVVGYELLACARACVSFELADASQSQPPGAAFDLVSCRYSLFLYLSAEKICAALPKLARRVRDGGFLLTGLSDRLPANAGQFGVHRLVCDDAPLGVYTVAQPGAPTSSASTTDVEEDAEEEAASTAPKRRGGTEASTMMTMTMPDDGLPDSLSELLAREHRERELFPPRRRLDLEAQRRCGSFVSTRSRQLLLDAAKRPPHAQTQHSSSSARRREKPPPIAPPPPPPPPNAVRRKRAVHFPERPCNVVAPSLAPSRRDRDAHPSSSSESHLAAAAAASSKRPPAPRSISLSSSWSSSSSSVSAAARAAPPASAALTRLAQPSGAASPFSVSSRAPLPLKPLTAAASAAAAKTLSPEEARALVERLMADVVRRECALAKMRCEVIVGAPAAAGTSPAVAASSKSSSSSTTLSAEALAAFVLRTAADIERRKRSLRAAQDAMFADHAGSGASRAAAPHQTAAQLGEKSRERSAMSALCRLAGATERGRDAAAPTVRPSPLVRYMLRHNNTNTSNSAASHAATPTIYPLEDLRSVLRHVIPPANLSSSYVDVSTIFKAPLKLGRANIGFSSSLS